MLGAESWMRYKVGWDNSNSLMKVTLIQLVEPVSKILSLFYDLHKDLKKVTVIQLVDPVSKSSLN